MNTSFLVSALRIQDTRKVSSRKMRHLVSESSGEESDEHVLLLNRKSHFKMSKIKF